MFINRFEVDIDTKHTYSDEELEIIIRNSNQFRARMLGGHALCELNFSSTDKSLDRILKSDIQNSVGTVWNLKVSNGKFIVWIRAISRNDNAYLHMGRATVRLITKRDSDGRIIPEKTKIIAFDIQYGKEATT